MQNVQFGCLINGKADSNQNFDSNAYFPFLVISELKITFRNPDFNILLNTAELSHKTRSN